MKLNKPSSVYKKLINLVYFWGPVVAWAFFIFSFSSVTTPRVSEVHWQDFIVKKMAHIFEYGVFALLLFRALKFSDFESKKALIYSFVLSFIYGITDEYHQSFTPGREPALRDALFDGFGSLIALLSIREVVPKTPEKFKLFIYKLGVKY